VKKREKVVDTARNTGFPDLAATFKPKAQAGTVNALRRGSATKGSSTNLNL